MQRTVETAPIPRQGKSEPCYKMASLLSSHVKECRLRAYPTASLGCKISFGISEFGRGFGSTDRQKGHRKILMT